MTFQDPFQAQTILCFYDPCPSILLPASLSRHSQGLHPFFGIPRGYILISLVSLLIAERLDWVAFEGSFQPKNYSVILLPASSRIASLSWQPQGPHSQPGAGKTAVMMSQRGLSVLHIPWERQNLPQSHPELSQNLRAASPRGRAGTVSVLRRHRGWAASGLCEILVVTFALFPLPPPAPALFLGIEGGGREGEETKVICHLLTTTFSILGHARKKHF